MATKKKFYVKVDSDSSGFAILLKSAACEWVLLFLLLIYAAFSHFLTKFAQYCNLQLPCLICSRLDHVLGKGKPDFYKELLCTDHRSEISSLISCKTHGKLADVHDMCEECLLSFAMKKETGLEICKFLIGKLGLDSLRNPDLKKDFLGNKPCSCCGQQWMCRPNVQKLVHSQSGSRGSKPDIPLPTTPRSKFLDRRHGLRNRDRLSTALGISDYNSLSDVGNTDGSKFSFKKQFEECFPVKPMNQLPYDTSKDLTDTAPEPEFGGKSNTRNSVPSDSYTVNEKKQQQEAQQKQSSAESELMPLDDIPLSSSKPLKADEGEIATALPRKLSSSGLSELILTNKFPPSKENGDIGNASKFKHWEAVSLNTPKSGTGFRHDQDKKDTLNTPKSGMGFRHDQDKMDTTASSSQNSYAKYPIDAAPVKKAVGSFQSPPNQHAKGELNEPNTDVRATSAEASPRSIKDSSLSGQSLLSNGRAAESQLSVLSGARDINEPGQKTPPMSRSQSYASLDGSSVGDYEGELQIDRLKRQVANAKDRISQLRTELEKERNASADDRISQLRKELEEERNASTVAANQAMAMITKLQEEKSVLHMEALQYLRMMEEQAEHDMDALEKANDMLAEREKDIQDLEAELDFYRLKYPGEFEEEYNAVNSIIDQSPELDGEHDDLDDLGTDIETEMPLETED